MRVILEGVFGSQAYGLATPESDEDVHGVFVAPTSKVLGLWEPKQTIHHTKPDSTHHEVGKFVRLALKSNPTIIEQLFLPEYRTLTAEGRLLIENRNAFLSQAVINSYGGYAISQARRLKKREAEGRVGFSPKTSNRYAKHARHCFRLLWQGREILERGTLTLRVADRDALFAIGEMDSDSLIARFESEFADFKRIVPVVPREPDYQTINDLLLEIRRMNP